MIDSLIVFNNYLFFRANNQAVGYELYKSDGTEQGTVLVKDIFPGSDPAGPSFFSILNNELYFIATNGINGIELWKTDGTEAGTIMAFDLYPGAQSSINSMYSYNGLLYLNARNATSKYQLYISDGTLAGTRLVKTIDAGGTFGSLFVLSIGYNNEVYFYASGNNGANGYELWKTDGTEAGTIMVKDICPGLLMN